MDTQNEAQPARLSSTLRPELETSIADARPLCDSLGAGDEQTRPATPSSSPESSSCIIGSPYLAWVVSSPRSARALPRPGNVLASDEERESFSTIAHALGDRTRSVPTGSPG